MCKVLLAIFALFSMYATGRCCIPTDKADFPATDGFLGFIYRLLGKQDIYEYEGNRRGVAPSIGQESAELDCTFDSSRRCCWYNINNNKIDAAADESEWYQSKTQITRSAIDRVFGSESPPDAPFLLTGSEPSIFSAFRSRLVSCPVVCQSNIGTLTFSHWLTPGATIEVCQLPVGSTRYVGRCTTVTGTGTSNVEIFPFSQPFFIVLSASGFSSLDGGLALIDDITYRDAKLCKPDTPNPKG